MISARSAMTPARSSVAPLATRPQFKGIPAGNNPATIRQQSGNDSGNGSNVQSPHRLVKDSHYWPPLLASEGGCGSGTFS